MTHLLFTHLSIFLVPTKQQFDDFGAETFENLRPHLQTFKDQYPTIKDATNKKLLADVISVLSMTDSPGENVIPESLKYKMLGSGEEVGFWGHEYVRNLASEIGIESTIDAQT